MTESRLSRAEILIQQQRYTDADDLLKNLLSEDPGDVRILALSAEVNLQLNKTENAAMLIDSAIGISPDISHLFFIKARIEIKNDHYNEAESLLSHALELDPDDADYYALWASVKLVRKQYQEALELSDRALAFDAENIHALNTRSNALLKLNKKEESFRTIEGALREDPTNSYTHANYGWNLLEQGQHKKALEHFREALKNDPNNVHAQYGMQEGIKANNPFYRVFLQYSFWMANLTAKYQWGVIIGFYALFKLLRVIVQNNPALEPFLTPVIVILSLVAFSTWIITPVSNLFLRFNAYGKHLLNAKETISANFVALSFFVALTGILAYFILNDEKFLTIAAFGLTMMVPLGSMFAPTRYKHALLIYTGLMALIGIGAIGITFSTGLLINGLTTIYVFAFIAFQWAANFLMIKEGNV